ncbi:MAG: glycosyltransferase [Planctomycetota bacterium]
MASSMRGGGSERQVWMLAKHLDRSRFEPQLYLTHREGTFLESLPEDVQVHSYDGATAHQGFQYPGKQLRHQSEAVLEIVRANKIDVVYDRTFHMTLLTGRIPNSVRRVSTIVSPPHLALPLVEKRFVFLKKQRLRKAYSRSHSLIAVSRAAADSAARFYRLPTRRIHVIHNGVEIENLRRQASAGREVQVAKKHRTTLLCVGRMTEEKGHADLLHAFRRFQESRVSKDDIHLRLIGDGPMRGELERLAGALGISDQVRFDGEVTRVAAAIADADALVLPSRFEGLPNVVLEAMAVGTPVIATRAGGTPELQGEHPTAMWAEPSDPASLARAIANFFTSPDQVAANREAATRLIEQEYRFERSMEEIERELLG